MGKGKSWSMEEEKQLVRSVLNISQDPEVGMQQRSDQYWGRILKHFRENLCISPENPDYCLREVKGLQHKWSEINHDTNKFCGCNNQVESLPPSGATEDDMVDHALKLYSEIHEKNQKFKYLHCWRILRKYPKWKNANSSSSAKKKKISDEVIIQTLSI